MSRNRMTIFWSQIYSIKFFRKVCHKHFTKSDRITWTSNFYLYLFLPWPILDQKIYII